MNKFLVKLDSFRRTKKGAEIIEIIFGVIIAGVVCVCAYKGIQAITNNAIKSANNAVKTGDLTQVTGGDAAVPSYGTSVAA